MKGLDETIAAISTPPGEGGVAIVRVSGAGAGGVARALLRGGSGEGLELEARQVRWARVARPGGRGVVDEVLAIWMPGPGSYTREDVLEIQCHGGQAVAREVLDAALGAGARLADPGEFTLRAYLRGRIDLVQAEAVLDTIQSRTVEALRVHENLLEGRLSREVGGWQEALGRIVAQIEAQLDFPEENVGELDLGGLVGRLRAVAEGLEEKLETFGWGRVSREGFRVALIGSPNVGKSSLLNCLAQEERAIVSPVPGTTRDAVEVTVSARGVAVRVTDTAGLRRGENEMEEEGVRRTRRVAGQADLILFVCDGGRRLSGEEAAEAAGLVSARRTLPVVNKVDLGLGPEEELRRIFGGRPLRVSAVTGEGMGDLLLALRDRAWGGGGPSAEAPLTRARQRKAVEEARDALRRALECLGGGGFLEVGASEVHAARRHLAQLLGWGNTEDVLDAIFSEFCIGK